MPSAVARQILPEIDEENARGTVRQIYEVIKTYRGLPLVPLIYRQLAAIPGVLPWAWSILQPIVVSGEIIKSGKRVSEGIDWNIAPLPPIPRSALRVMGVDASSEAKISSVFDTLNYMNPGNLISARYLGMVVTFMSQAHMAKQPEEDRRQVYDFSPPAALPPLPRLVSLSAMSDSLANLVCSLGRRGDERLVPHLYRHLANWPSFLALAATLTLPRLRSGEIDAFGTRVLDKVDEEVKRLRQQYFREDDVPSLSQESCASVGALVERYSQKHPEMIVVCTLLRQAMPPRDATD